MMNEEKMAYEDVYHFINPALRGIDVEDLLKNTDNYHIVSGDLDNYFTLKFKTKDLSSLIYVRTFLEIEGFTVMGEKDIYKYIKIYNKYKDLLDEKDPLLKEFYKDSLDNSCYGKEKKEDFTYYFYFFFVNERRNIKTFYDFCKIYLPLITELLDGEEAILSICQQDKVVSGDIYFGAEKDSSQNGIILNTDVSSIRDTYILSSILRLLAKNKEELGSMNISYTIK